MPFHSHSRKSTSTSLKLQVPACTQTVQTRSLRLDSTSQGEYWTSLYYPQTQCCPYLQVVTSFAPRTESTTQADLAPHRRNKISRPRSADGVWQAVGSSREVRPLSVGSASNSPRVVLSCTILPPCSPTLPLFRSPLHHRARHQVRGLPYSIALYIPAHAIHHRASLRAQDRRTTRSRDEVQVPRPPSSPDVHFKFLRPFKFTRSCSSPRRHVQVHACISSSMKSLRPSPLVTPCRSAFRKDLIECKFV